MGRLLSGAVLVLAVGYASAAQPRLRPSATLFAATPAEVRSVAASGAAISLSPRHGTFTRAWGTLMVVRAMSAPSAAGSTHHPAPHYATGGLAPATHT